MSVSSDVNCPVCGAEGWMTQDDDYKRGTISYFCRVCGYGNVFKERHEKGQTYLRWDRRYERRKHIKFVDVQKEPGLIIWGKWPFYPMEMEYDEFRIYPRSKSDKLVWKLYSSKNTSLGEFVSFKEAMEAGDQYAENLDAG